MERKKWEYCVSEIEYKTFGELQFAKELDKFGKLGWELVSINWRNDPLGRNVLIAVCTFKRESQ